MGVERITGRISLPEIFCDHWSRYLAWRGDETDSWTRQVVGKMLGCRTPALGCHLYVCPDCRVVRVVPHSCKTAFCSSCGTARSEAWCQELLSEILQVPYRHLVFTLPRELRHLIRTNKTVLLNAMYRAASQAVLSLTAGRPEPKPGLNRKRMRRKRKPYLPGLINVAHTFASDLKFNPHLHLLTTAGGLSLDHSRWIDAPRRSLIRVHDLAREWKKNVLAEIRRAEDKGLLYHPPFGGDPDNPTDVEALLICVVKKRWWVHIGPSLQEVDHVLRYCCRYTRRPVIGEMRILRYDGNYVDFLYNDYYEGGRKRVMRRSAVNFIHRLIQHIPPKNFIQVRYYGLFATAKRGELLPLARRLLGRRKRRRRPPLLWRQRRIRRNGTDPLSCPQCGQTMREFGTLFGCPDVIAIIAGIDLCQRLPFNCFVPLSRVQRLSRVA